MTTALADTFSTLAHVGPQDADWSTPRYIYETGEWEYRGERWTGCYGHPIGSCRAPKTEGPYCLRCYAAYMGECASDSRIERVTAIIEEGIADGYLPAVFRHWRRGSLYPQQQAAYDELQANERACAWVHGRPGTGKTHIALTLAYSYLQRCRKVAIATSQVLYEARNNHRTNAALLSAELLILDDIDKGNLGAVQIGHIHRILDARHVAHLRTIVTSEYKGSEVCTRFREASGKEYGGISTIGRLDYKGCPCLSIEIIGQNLRRSA